MTTFWSCHLIANRTLAGDGRHIRDFIDADFLYWEGISTLFLEQTQSSNANILSCYYAHFGGNIKDLYC